VSSLVFMGLFAAAGPPSPALRVEGPCATALVESLKRERPGAAVDQGLASPGDLRVHIRSQPHPWRVEVSGTDGQARLRRSLSSRTCAEAADAAAVIVERFLESIAWQGGDARVEAVGAPLAQANNAAPGPALSRLSDDATQRAGDADAGNHNLEASPRSGPREQPKPGLALTAPPEAQVADATSAGPPPPDAVAPRSAPPVAVARADTQPPTAPRPTADAAPTGPSASHVPVALAIPGAVAPGGELASAPATVERPIESGPSPRWLGGAEVSVGGAATLGNVGVVPAASLEAAVRVREVVRVGLWVGGAGSESQDVLVTYPGATTRQVQGQVLTREGFAYATATLCKGLTKIEGCAGLAGGAAFSYATASGQLYQKQHAVLAPPVAAAVARLAYRWAAGPEIGIQMLGGVALTKPSLVVDTSSFYASRFEWIGALHAGWAFP
jgi:hypothetical protein